MLRIWGRLSSVNVQKVAWCADELGCPYERIDAGRQFGIVGTDEFRRLNPNRQIPVIQDGEFVLWESNAILRYLCAKHSLGDLCPEPLTERADADRWMDWQATELSPAMSKAFMQWIRTPPHEREPALIEASVQATRPLVRLLDEHLEGRRFVCGTRMTMADISMGCAVHRWFGLPIEQESLPNLVAWYRRVSERPAARAVLTLPLQ